MSDPTSTTPPSPGAAPTTGRRSAAALFGGMAAEMVHIVMRRAEAGDRHAMRLCLEHGLIVGSPPPPELLAICRAIGLEETLRSIASMLEDGRMDTGEAVRLLWTLRRPRRAPPATNVIALADAQTRRRTGDLRCSAAKAAGALVNINENTSAKAAGGAAGRGPQQAQPVEIVEEKDPEPA